MGQLGQTFSGIGQQASVWLPAITQMMGMRAQAARDQLNAVLNMPGLSDEARRKAIADAVETTKHLPPWMRIQWPKVQAPGPVVTPGQPAVPAKPEVPGTAPQPQDINAPGGGLAPPTGYQPAQPGRPAVPEVRGPSTEQYYVPPQPLTVGDLVKTDDAIFHNMPDAMRQRIARLPLDQAVQIPGLREHIGQTLGLGGDFDRPVASLGPASKVVEAVRRAGFDPARVTIRQAMAIPGVSDVMKAAIRPPVDVSSLVVGKVMPGREAEAQALVARVQAAVQAGTISEGDARNILQNSGYWEKPASREEQARRFQSRLAGAVAAKDDAALARVKAEMQAAGFSPEEIVAATKDARSAVAQQQMQAPTTVTVGGRTYTVPQSEAARLAAMERDRELTRQMHERDLAERRADRAAAREAAAMQHASNRWLAQYDTVNRQLTAAENAAIAARADVDELTRQQQAIAATLKDPQNPGFADAMADSASVQRRLREAQVKLKAAEQVLAAQQARYKAITSELSTPGEPSGVPGAAPPRTAPPPPPSGRPGAPTVGPGTPTAGAPRTAAPNPETMAYWRTWRQTNQPIPAAIWNKLPPASQRWLDSEGVPHQ